MEYVLSDPGDPAEEAGRAYGGLLTAIEAIAIEMRARGLAVHVDVADGVPIGAGGPGGDATPAGSGGTAHAPVAVVVSVAHALRDALSNVDSHAGTDEAWVYVTLDPCGIGTEPDGLPAIIRDEH